MESSSDSYLHKKFKKQLTIDVRSKSNDNDLKEAPLREQSQEKKILEQQQQEKCNPVTDNNEKKIVPNQSTNTSSSSFTPNSSISTTVKSSISIDQQTSNSCISHIESLPASFDTKFSDQTTNYVNSTSSILDNYYQPRRNYTDDSYPYDYSVKQDDQDGKSDEASPLPDKASGSKYVCSYCSMVCSKPSVLQKHIRAHTNERPYPCKSCGFSFKTRSNLYKHCRSRTHANRVMGNKIQDSNNEADTSPRAGSISEIREEPTPPPKPYKPRFHTNKQPFENSVRVNSENEVRNHRSPASEMLSHHINEIINKNSTIVNLNESPVKIKIHEDEDQPLNLTNKNRKRTMSEISEPVIHKSLIKELLLKNLSSSDMQCPYCKMIFQTVTELDVHKYRSCKGKSSNIKYTRSSSVNVASILTQNKNAFDDIPQFQNAVFPLNSPGPFLGKTRLVDSDKSKSFSFDNGNLPLMSPSETSPMFFPSSLQHDKEKKHIKFFGGEVKVQSLGETKSFKVDANNDQFQPETNYREYGGKLSENRVIKSSLQSGGTVLTNKTNYNNHDLKTPQEVIRVYDNNTLSPNINFNKQKFTFDRCHENNSSEIIEEPVNSNKPYDEYKYTNIMDFSQNAVKMLTPNIKQPNFNLPNINHSRIENMPSPKPKQEHQSNVITSIKNKPVDTQKFIVEPKPLYAPLNLFVNGKVVRHVPGMPGPVVAAETPVENYGSNIVAVTPTKSATTPKLVNFYVQQQTTSSSSMDKIREKEPLPCVPEIKLPSRTSEPQTTENEIKKFVRPNSLALKPTTAALKQHHGLTPTMFNQILISPDTPRVDKKYAEHFLHGNYFSYLGLKSSTKPVYCTLNKTQPFYVHHFNALSMYSEWRQQDTKQDKFYASSYDSRQRNRRYTIAGKTSANLIIHSSYKFIVSEVSSSKTEKSEDQQRNNVLPGGYESNDDYTYVRGRGRGRYVCDQCGIRCKKPSMLKKHIRTHSNDRPYTCNHCNFSFKTKGNLTKHMRSKAHTKNYTASSGSSSSTQPSPQSSESDTEDSGMDSSDESTRQQEHEAAYGLLSLSQKPTQSSLPSNNSELPPLPPSTLEFSISSEEVAYVSKTNYAKNKILDEQNSLKFASKKLNEVPIVVTAEETLEMQNVRNYLGKCNLSRPLTYPYTGILSVEREVKSSEVTNSLASDNSNESKNIKQFHVIQKYIPHMQLSPNENECLSPKKNDVLLNNKRNNSSPSLPPNPSGAVVVVNENISDLRKRKIPITENTSSFKTKIQKNDEVIDLSMPVNQDKVVVNGVSGTIYNEFRLADAQKTNELYNKLHKIVSNHAPRYEINGDKEDSYCHKVADHENNNGTVIILSSIHNENRIYVDELTKVPDYDNSAMETLADVATKQVKLEKNTLAKSVASEFLKLATKNENLDGRVDSGKFNTNHKNVNDLIVKSEGNKSCTICAKSFNKPSQLRLHMNIHYLERPFRCDPCSVSFRTKGHLQKHERSASHHNKLSSSPALSSSEPRPFKCSDCNIAFRIHGHLAKHLRSKMHIMKLECLAKVPFGLYAELERSNSLLTEINTSDGEQCLESLKTLAKKVFINDPSKLNQLELRENVNSADC